MSPRLRRAIIACNPAHSASIALRASDGSSNQACTLEAAPTQGRLRSFWFRSMRLSTRLHAGSDAYPGAIFILSGRRSHRYERLLGTAHDGVGKRSQVAWCADRLRAMRCWLYG